MDTKNYYDRFSERYEEERDHGYHALVDDLESALVRSIATPITSTHGAAARVLEAGCGTGLVLSRVASSNGHGASSVFGADLSRGMVAHARDRGLRVIQADLLRLPYRDASFDVVCSFKVLAHVPDRAAALRELTRVVRPGGKLILEYYNRRSIRYLAKRFGPKGEVANGTRESDIYTRFDTLAEIRGDFPRGVRLLGVRGIRTFTAWAPLHDMPVVGPMLAAAERRAFDSPLAHLAGFLIVIAERTRP